MSRVSRAISRRRDSGEEAERAHVVEPVGELDHHDPQVGDHRQDHLPEGLGLLLLARDVGELADLRQAVDELGDLGPELLGDRLLGRQGVLEDVVQEADDDRDVVGLQVRQDRGHVQGMDEVGLARAPDLPLVLARREDVGPPQQVLVRARVVRLDLLEDLLEVDHDPRRVTRMPPAVSRTLPALRVLLLRRGRARPPPGAPGRARRRACGGS